MEEGKILEAIQRINKEYSDKSNILAANGNVLSYVAVKLASMKGYLMDVKQIAHGEMMQAEIDMDEAKAKAYLKAKEAHNATAASDLKNMDPDYIAARKVYAGKKVEYEKIKSAVADSHDLIEAIRSRVIDLQGARKDESIR